MPPSALEFYAGLLAILSTVLLGRREGKRKGCFCEGDFGSLSLLWAVKSAYRFILFLNHYFF